MTTDLEKIDIIRERLDVSYRQAKEALERANGDVLEAIVSLEDSGNADWTDRFQKRGQEVVGQLKSYAEKGNDTKIKVKQGDKTLFEVPASVGALGLIGVIASTPLAIAAGIGTVVAMANQVTLEINKDKNQAENMVLEEESEPPGMEDTI